MSGGQQTLINTSYYKGVTSHGYRKLSINIKK